MLGSSSANNFSLNAGEGVTDLLRTHLQSVRSSHSRVTLVAQNGIGLIEQCPTGYAVPAALNGIVTVNTSLNITFSLAKRPDVVIVWQPAANLPEYEDNVGLTTVAEYEDAIDNDMIPAMQAIQTACLNQGCAFYCIGSHSMTAAGKTTNGVTTAQMTGRHYWDIRLAATFGASYINGGWDDYSIGTGYDDAAQEVAIASGVMDTGTGSHYNAATSSAFFTARVVPVGLAGLRDRRNAIDVVP